MVVRIPHGSDSEKKGLHDVFVTFCIAFVHGKLPHDQRHLFSGAKRIPLAKKPSGVRPIAVEETLCCLAAKCLVGRYQASAVETLKPL